ncbi:hypothetical protein H5410_014291 [Solanum commersonii]|uniref:Uncharacterized protein n=1 Tax=Solanum commersonii TaxID=4109 RepID=A0A9J5ZQT4_SOLCO|nr:hypothetical protein H5410_014291 [Solanum commersonii]
MGVGRVRGREAEFDGPWTREKSVQNSSRTEAIEVKMISKTENQIKKYLTISSHTSLPRQLKKEATFSV